MAVRVTRAGVGLIIGIIVLAGLVWGGLYLVKERGEAARRDETLKIAEQKLKDESNKGVALNQGDKDKDTSKGDDKNDASSGGSSTTLPGGQSNNGSEGDNANLPTTGPSVEVTELPQTGVVDTGSILAVGLLTFSVISYIVSRRQL